ncbi:MULTISPECIES: serine/threonine-protein kinase [Streptomyces]|uniref:non-specific serine/threonine protein kinase n=2 Tax=Streptomyces TaxID=1883 RepID=A0A100Y5C5_9ACTN|nr:MULTISPECIES: serine/threonine-protein kinase [Streptomyces]KUH37933.1 serine/threonine protein kinase [Streptomyces kanasensis]UUS29744.1 serine/threonine protein kinase [Streptomyces changanensis]
MDGWSVPGYTDVRELGSGACGRVVLAVHDATGLPVAVKYLGEGLRGDPAFVRGFRDEARLLGTLASPHVVGLYEYVEAPEGAAIVMELVDGLALRALLREYGAVGPEAALTVLKGSLLGLAAAHARGVVHRDYKPENVLVTADGASRLVDFGIATGDGAVVAVAGTPAYMAPEQWTGAPASPASDVYAATAVFHECLTGRKPFTGENIAELALMHVEAPVPVEGVPEPLRALVRRGLAKTPRERPGEAAAFVAELEAAAAAACGPGWEERGRGRLASLAALLPLLFPSAGDRAGSATDLATTSLGDGDGGGDGGGWWRAWLPGPLGWAAVAGALLLGLVPLLGGASQATSGPAGTGVEAVATTGVRPVGDTPAPSPTGGASPAPTPSAPTPSAPTPSAPTPSAAASTGPAPSPTPTGTATGATDAPSGTPDARETAAPSTTGPPATAPPPSGEAPAPAAPAAPTGPRPGTSAPPPSTAPPATGVRSVAVRDFRQSGPATATATFDVTTDGPGPVTLHVTWYAGDAWGNPGTQDGPTETYRRGGADIHTLTLTHTFRTAGCHWTAAVTTDPAPAGGASSRQLRTRRCEIR